MRREVALYCELNAGAVDVQATPSCLTAFILMSTVMRARPCVCAVQGGAALLAAELCISRVSVPLKRRRARSCGSR